MARAAVLEVWKLREPDPRFDDRRSGSDTSKGMRHEIA
jgi:hypothetical protein